MKKFRVLRPEVHYAHVIVDAESPEEAREKVRDGEGEETYVEYSHTMEERDPKDWEATEEEEDNG